MFDQSAAVDQGIVLKQMQILATASSKMVCGQVLDLQSEGKQVDQATFEKYPPQQNRWLISAAVMMAAVTVFDGRDKAIPQLREYAQAIGLAFQVQDDILDIISDTEVLGKTAGKDQEVEKSTYPRTYGLGKSTSLCTRIARSSLAVLTYFKSDNVLELQIS